MSYHYIYHYILFYIIIYIIIYHYIYLINIYIYYNKHFKQFYCYIVLNISLNSIVKLYAISIYILHTHIK